MINKLKSVKNIKVTLKYNFFTIILPTSKDVLDFLRLTFLVLDHG